jgi:opacity protein-like surface antigen
MRNTIRAIAKVSFFVFVLVAPALTQSRPGTGAQPAASGPDYDVSVGYTCLTMPIPGAGRVDLNGLDVSGRVDLKPHWGAMVDSNYVRTSNVLGTKHDGYLLSFLGGPVFYPVDHGNTRVFVHVLAGVGIVDGAVPARDTEYHGWLGRFSYAVGGGVEHSVSRRFAVRVIGDYLRTAFFDSVGAVQPQNNFRVTTSLVFRLK